jgi:hypothetical protein
MVVLETSLAAPDARKWYEHHMRAHSHSMRRGSSARMMSANTLVMIDSTAQH